MPTNHNHNDPPHFRDISEPCCCCGAKWVPNPDAPGKSGCIMDHAEDCAYMRDEDR